MAPNDFFLAHVEQPKSRISLYSTGTDSGLGSIGGKSLLRAGPMMGDFTKVLDLFKKKDFVPRICAKHKKGLTISRKSFDFNGVPKGV